MTSFALTYDYRCPFARNAHEHVATALAAGAGWDVRFVPFSLSQVHVAPGEPDIWDRPGEDSGLLALQVGVAVRRQRPDRFLEVHCALFALRHDQAGRLQDEAALRSLLDGLGVDAGAVLDEVASGGPAGTVREEHEEAASKWGAWGVPTFVLGDRAAFVRLMDRPGRDPALSIRSIERILDLLGSWPALNEFKHTSVPR